MVPGGRDRYNARPGTSRESTALHKNEFPTFEDADVKVVVSESRQYQLHESALRNNSSTLRELLTDEDTPAFPSSVANKDNVFRRKLVLVPNPKLDDSPDDIDYIFGVFPPDSREDALPDISTSIASGQDTVQIATPLLNAFDSVLGAFYNRPINLGNFEDDGMASLLSSALQITVVAEYLDCVHIVTNPIEATLLATGQAILRAISECPTPWLSFAHRIKSRYIFREALIHAAGKYNTDQVRETITSLPQSVANILHSKGQFIKEGVKISQRKINSYYPKPLMREKTVGLVDKDNIGRASYGNDILFWMALTIFRMWCVDHMADDQTHHAPDLGYAFVSTINKGGDAYLTRTVMADFHFYFPMSTKAMAAIEHRLSEIKENVKQWTRPLMINSSQLDIRQNPVEHFTYIRVDHEDYPWESPRTTTSELSDDPMESDDVPAFGTEYRQGESYTVEPEWNDDELD